MKWIYVAHVPYVLLFLLFTATLVCINWFWRGKS